jgi:o-succinylbenzoate synthase
VHQQVPTGIALGIAGSVDDLVTAAAGWCAQGHRALKLKIAPGWDLGPVQAVRDAVGDEVTLVADANGSYRSDDPGHLDTLGRLISGTGGLAAVEQPFAPADLTGHARLARKGPVPICLDESVGSLADVETALALGACGAVNLKPGRVGGLVEAGRIHQRCLDDGVPLRAGGMLETGLGRAVNLAVAALPGCTLPPDLGPSTRYFPRDITPPHLAHGGTMTVPDGPGLGVEPIQEVLDEVTTDQLFLRAPS